MSAPFGNAARVVEESEILERTGISMAVAANMPEFEPVLLPYQKRWFEDESQVKIAEKSRRTGITWAEAAANAVTVIKPRSRGGRNVYYVGSRQEMALEYIAACALFLRAFSKLAVEVNEEIFTDKDGDKEILTYVIRIPATGFKIQALSSRPSNLRGMQGDVVIDEAAFHERLDELLKAAMALTMWGARVRLISTHNGEDNLFNKYIQDARAGRKDYSVHHIDIDTAIIEGLYKRICYVTHQEWSEDAQVKWRDALIRNAPNIEAANEEYLCIPSQGSGAYMPRILIEGCMHEAPIKQYRGDTEFNKKPEPTRRSLVQEWLDTEVLPLLQKLNPKHRHKFGYDFARSGDLSVISPFEITNDLQRNVPFMVEMHNMPHKQQEQVLFFICNNLPRFGGGKIDARGNGSYVAESAVDEYGEHLIEAVMLTVGWYRENMPKYKAAFEDKIIRVPRSDDVATDHAALKLVNGVPKLPDGKTDAKGERHGDSAIALALGYISTLEDAEEFGYEAVKVGGNGDSIPREIITNHGFGRSRGIL